MKQDKTEHAESHRNDEHNKPAVETLQNTETNVISISSEQDDQTARTLMGAHNSQVVEPMRSSVAVQEFTHKRSSKVLLIFILALVLVAIGAASYVFTHKPHSLKRQSVSTVDTATSDFQAPSPITTTGSAHFFYASDNRGVTDYNVTTKKLTSVTLYNGAALSGFAAGLYTDGYVQVSQDGKTIAYFTQGDDACPGAEGGCGPVDTSIYVRRGSAVQRVVHLVYPEDISNWVLTNDGSTLFYSPSRNEPPYPAKPVLHQVSLSTNEDSSLVASSAMQNSPTADPLKEAGTPLIKYGTSSVRYYEIGPTITEYKIEDGVIKAKDFGATGCQGCSPELYQTLSPDGTKLLLSQSTSMSAYSGYFTYDLSKGTLSPTPTNLSKNEYYRTESWSPDSRYIARAASNSADVTKIDVPFDYRLEILDMMTGKYKVVYSNPVAHDKDQVSHEIDVLGWSPDQRYIAFSEGDILKIYSISTGSVSNMDFPALDQTSPGPQSVGWFSN